MSAVLYITLIGSLALLVAEFGYRVVTMKPGLLSRALVIVAGAALVYAVVPGRVDQMGGVDESAALILSYAAMLAGMLAEHGYGRIERNERLRLDATILLPILASPIVFIPLLTLTSEIGGGGAFTRAKLMVYLVAFQNGFFWKTFFEQQRKKHPMQRPSARVAVREG